MKDVPNVVGKGQDEASRTLTDAGLALGAVTDAYSEDVPPGQVISQSVAAGTSMAHDSTVDVVLSKGREPRTVPTLTGKVLPPPRVRSKPSASSPHPPRPTPTQSPRDR